MNDYDDFGPLICDFFDTGLEDNPVYTFLYLSGTPEALDKASGIILKLHETGIATKDFIIKPDEIKEGTDGDNRWFEIDVDNHVPQIYEELKAIEGMESVIFVVYSSFDTFMMTNDVDGVMWKRRELFGIPAELEVETVSDLDNDYPDTFDHASFNYNIM